MNWAENAKKRGLSQKDRGSSDQNNKDRKREEDLLSAAKEAKQTIREYSAAIEGVFSDLRAAGVEVKGPLEGVVVREFGYKSDFSPLRNQERDNNISILGDERWDDGESHQHYYDGITWASSFFQFSLFAVVKKNGNPHSYEIRGYGVNLAYDSEIGILKQLIRDHFAEVGISTAFHVDGKPEKMMKAMRRHFSKWAERWFAEPKRSEREKQGMLTFFSAAAREIAKTDKKD